MTIINKARIEEALKQARDKMRTNEDNRLSERYIEAKASVECLEFVLRYCHDANTPEPKSKAAIHIIPYNKYLIEEELKKAMAKMESIESDTTYYEAKVKVDCLQWILELLKDSNNTAVAFAEYLLRNEYMTVVTGPQINRPGWTQKGKNAFRSSEDLFNEFEKESMGF